MTKNGRKQDHYDILDESDTKTANLVELIAAIRSANELDDVTMRIVNNVLQKLNVDPNGRLRVAAETTTFASNQSVPYVGGTQIGPFLVAAYGQMMAGQLFKAQFLSNLVKS